MEIAKIKAETRKPGSRNANQRLRRGGMIPAVIYGHGEEPETVAVSLHDMALALQHLAHVVNLQINGQEHQYLIKDVQYDHLQKTPIHVDLMRVDPNERVQVKVPIILRGTPKGVQAGGALTQMLTELNVECRLLNIPTELRVRIDHLEINGTLHVKEIELSADVTSLHEPEDVVVVVQPPRTMAAAEEEEGETEESAGAEPEIISKGKEEGEESPQSGG